MRESTPRAPSRDEDARLARTRLDVAARMLMPRTTGDHGASFADVAFAASVRDADATLWASVDSGDERRQRPAS